jgi:hypothetical protein
VKVRWWWWVLALVPAVAGVVSIAMGVGDFRSSGLILGVSLSLGLMAIILLVRASWRGRRGVSKWLVPVPGLMLGAVGLLGVSEGLPEFLQARGLAIDVDSVGPVAVLDLDGTLVIVGNDTTGGFAWTSDDGSNWNSIGDERMTELEIVDATLHGSTVVVIGQSTEAEGVVMVTEDGEHFEESGRFANSENGTIPQAVDRFAGGLVVISEIYGNDVEFHMSNDTRSWVAGKPAPVFDDGESARDIACSDQVCLGVGFLDSTYRQDLEANTGFAWVSSSDGDYQPVNYNFDAESLDAVAWNRAGFVAVGANSAGKGSAWHSSDGTEWTPVSSPFTGITVDGIAAFDNSYFVFGRNPTTGAVTVWTSEDTTDWSETVVTTGLPEASRIRSITSTKSGLVAAGINGATYGVLVWTSPDGKEWKQTATLPPR